MKVEPELFCVQLNIRLNGDGHLQSKFSGSGDLPIAYSDRKMLIDLATQDMPWLETSDLSSRRNVEDLRRRYGHWAVFHHFEMNGADDVCKYVSLLPVYTHRAGAVGT